MNLNLFVTLCVLAMVLPWVFLFAVIEHFNPINIRLRRLRQERQEP